MNPVPSSSAKNTCRETAQQVFCLTNRPQDCTYCMGGLPSTPTKGSKLTTMATISCHGCGSIFIFVLFCFFVFFFLFSVHLVVDCGDPGNPYGGYHDISGGTTFRSTVTYTCKANHHLEGEDSQTCQGNGQWSGFKPVCLGINSIFCFVQNSSFATYPLRSAFRARMIVWLGSDRLCIIQFAELVG